MSECIGCCVFLKNAPNANYPNYLKKIKYLYIKYGRTTINRK